MKEDIKLTDDPLAMILTLCGVCRDYCDDTMDQSENAMLGFIIEKSEEYDRIVYSPKSLKNGGRIMHKLKAISHAISGAAEAFVWRRKRQAIIVQEMCDLLEPFYKIVDRYKADIISEEDYHSLKRIMRITDFNIEKTKQYFLNEEDKAALENDFEDFRDEVEPLLFEYEGIAETLHWEDDDDEEEIPEPEPIFCPACQGSGIRSFCKRCGGTGFTQDDKECSPCGGAGWEYCPECSSTGRIKYD